MFSINLETKQGKVDDFKAEKYLLYTQQHILIINNFIPACSSWSRQVLAKSSKIPKWLKMY